MTASPRSDAQTEARFAWIPDDAARRATRRWTVFLAVVDAAVFATAAYLASLGERAIALVLAYGALSLLAVTALYARAVSGHNPGPWLKGQRAPWLQPLFVPYRAVAWLVTLSARVVRARDESISDIGGGLFLGVRLFLPEASRLEDRGVTCVVDLCAELPTNARLDRAPFERLEVPVLDRCPPTADEFTHAVDWAAARLGQGRSVYVHCAFGRGRSALVAAAVLLRVGSARTADEAIAQLRRARPAVRLNPSQRAALDAYARHLAGDEARAQ